MRASSLTLGLIALAAAACSRGVLQSDAGMPPWETPWDGGFPSTDAPAGLDGASPTDTAPPPDALVPGADGINCGSTATYRSRRIPYDILLVVDRSIDRAKWNDLVSMLAYLTASKDMEISWGLTLFPEDGPSCGDGTVTDKIDVPIAVKNAAAVNAALAAATPTGNGTPTAAALQVAHAYLGTVADESPRFLMLVTDGAPTCGGTAGMLTSDAAQAQADALAAINQDSAAHRTFVVGAGVTAAADIDALNALAVAGGYPRMNSPQFYPSSNVTELRDALSTISSASYTCTFRMPEAPPGPVSVLVMIDGVAIPQDSVNGWEYTDATHATFTFHGSACERLFMSWEFEVQVSIRCLLI